MTNTNKCNLTISIRDTKTNGTWIEIINVRKVSQQTCVMLFNEAIKLHPNMMIDLNDSSEEM